MPLRLILRARKPPTVPKNFKLFSHLEQRLLQTFRCSEQHRQWIKKDILNTNPHLVGRSHPVSVEVPEFDWGSSRKGASQLPRTTTIRLRTPKTTTGEILIFASTSPLSDVFVFSRRRSIRFCVGLNVAGCDLLVHLLNLQL